MTPFEIILNQLPALYEYQKKQLSIILISETLTDQTKIETLKTILNKKLFYTTE